MRSPPSPRSAPSAPARRASTRLRASARHRRALGPPALAFVLALAFAGCGGSSGEGPGDGSGGSSEDRFDSASAFELIDDQVALGQRPAGSAASRRLARRLRAELPNGSFEPLPGGLRNVVGTLPGALPAIVVGAHYDTEAHPPGVVGANDGAAGTAAVVEVARALQAELPAEHREVRFVAFDGEEEPLGCPDAQFEQCALRGSKAYAAAHAGELGEMVLLDYVANRDLQIPREANSDPRLWAELRGAAAEVGTESYFPPEGAGPEFAIIDDHIPFLRAGVPSIDLIDFSYPYADTVEDTPDKLDPAALDAVGETVTELVLRLATER
jgi:hypothetical protein